GCGMLPAASTTAHSSAWWGSGVTRTAVPARSSIGSSHDRRHPTDLRSMIERTINPWEASARLRGGRVHDLTIAELPELRTKAPGGLQTRVRIPLGPP